MDVLGKKFKSLIVLGYNQVQLEREEVFLRCNCGHEFSAKYSDVISEEVECKSCSKKNRKDYIGMRFGKWTVLDNGYTKGTNKYVLCKCDCGTEKMVSVSGLTSGNSQSCRQKGCIEKIEREKPTPGRAGRPKKLPEPNVEGIMAQGRCFMSTNLYIHMRRPEDLTPEFIEHMRKNLKIEVHQDKTWRKLAEGEV